MVIDDDAPVSRAERRRRSESAILDAARQLFADVGYERTTIRAVAQRAGVDAALVMQNFGSKDGLFAAAVRWSVPTGDLTGADRGDLSRMALQHALDAFDDPVRRPAAEALLRSCFTHPGAREVLRDEVMRHTQAEVAATIGGADAGLRAALLNAVTLGVTISRYLLEDPAVAHVDPADLHRILGPALDVLAGTA